MKDNALLHSLFRKIAFNDDREAFKELFFDFYPSLCVFAQRYISSPEVCEDIVQETFYNLWKNRKKIEVTSSFRNYLITSVKNSCTDYLRKQSVRQNYAKRKTADEEMDTPEEIYTIGELEEMFHAALERLSPNVRKAFELSRLEHMTYNKIAEKMNISPKTVEVYISKALSVLRTALKDYLPLLFLSCKLLVG